MLKVKIKIIKKYYYILYYIIYSFIYEYIYYNKYCKYIYKTKKPFESI